MSLKEILTIGSVSIGIFWTVVQLWKHFGNRTKLIAVAEHSTFVLPAVIKKEISTRKWGYELRRLAEKSIADDLLKDPKTDRIVHAALDGVGEADSKSLQNTYRVLPDITYQFKISVSNKGKKEIPGVHIELPMTGFYQDLDGGDSLFPIEKNTINLGILRGGNSKDVLIWATSYYVSEYDLKKVRVTYPDGLVKVSFALPVRGVAAFILKNSFFIYLGFVGIIFLGLFVNLIFKIIAIKTSPQPNSAEPAVALKSQPDDAVDTGPGPT